MALISWTNEYAVNISIIDNQHKTLIALINILHDKMKQGKGKLILDVVLTELTEYTIYHFSTEEELFRKYNYQETKAHLIEHNKLLEEVTKIKNNFDSGNTVITLELMNFLKNWLENHILKSDKKYSSFLKSKGVE
ncbi:MAG: bacteriohemerythrin [bacterium]